MAAPTPFPKKEKPRALRRGGKRLTLPDVRRLDARNKALELRIAGFTYKQIGEKLKVSHHTVFAYIQEELHDLRAKTELNAEAVRDLESERLDAIFRGLAKKVAKGEPAAAQAAVKVLERKSKLLGLDAPVKVEAVVQGAVSAEAASKMSATDIEKRLQDLTLRLKRETTFTKLKELVESSTPADVDAVAVKVD